jgi:O-antigen/teichoic acid export membrane protein
MVRKVLTNSASNVALVFVKAALTFIMAPIIVRALGNYDYGIWEVIIGVTGYMGLLDVGIRPAITRYVARYCALDDANSLRKLYSTSLVFMVVIGFLAFSGLLAWALTAPGLLAQKGADPARYLLLLIIIGSQLLINFPGFLMESVHEGFQRYTLKNTVTMATSLIGITILFFLLQRGYGLLTLALGNAIGTSVKFGVYWILLRSPKYGHFRFSRKDVSGTCLKELLGFGSKNFVQNIAATVTRRTDPIILGAFLGPVAVTFYMVPANLVFSIRNLLWSITQVFMPFFSELDAQGSHARLSRVFTVSSRFVVGIVLPLLGGAWFLGIPFLSRWMGPEYAERGKWVLYIFLIAYGLRMLNPFHSRYLTGIGRQGVLAIIKSIMAAINIVFSILLVRWMGKEGVALGSLIPVILLEPVILHYTCKNVGITMWEYTRDVFGPLIMPSALFILSLWVFTSNLVIETYASITVVGLVSSLLYVVAFALLGMHRDEQRYIVTKVKARIAASSTIAR